MNREFAVNQLKAVFEILADDIEEIRAYGKENPSDFAHRTLFRTHFAFIEGMTYQLRQVALCSVQEHLRFFTSAEISMLREEKYCLNRKGKVESQDNFQKLLPSILFSIQCYCKIHGADYQPDTGNNGWNALGKYLEIRNQLMHPKSTDDLKISEEKLVNSLKAAEWFKRTLMEMFEACDIANKKLQQNT